MGLTLTTPPAEEPLSLAEAKAHLRWESTDEEATITALIVAARQQAEHLTGRALVTQTWTFTLDAFPAGSLELPKAPLASVTSIKYLDAAGVQQTLDPSEYQVIADELIGRVVPAYGKAWPGGRKQPGAVEVVFVAGYGNGAAVPQGIKAWLKLKLGTLFENRQAVIVGTSVAELPRPVWDALLDPYRLYLVA